MSVSVQIPMIPMFTTKVYATMFKLFSFILRV